MLHQQFISIKRDPTETVSCFNQHFHMAYYKLEMPYTIIVEAFIHIYMNDMGPLTGLFLRRIPPTNIDTLEKVFAEAIMFTKQANPNGEGMMHPGQAITTIPTYPIGAPMVPRKFIPMNLVPLQ